MLHCRGLSSFLLGFTVDTTVTVAERTIIIAPRYWQTSRQMLRRTFSSLMLRRGLQAPLLSAQRHMSAGADRGSAADEDREDLERERLLREKFAQKINANRPESTETVGAAASPFGGFGSPVSVEPNGRRLRLLLFLTILLFLPLLLMRPMMASSGGMGWHELPVITSAYYLLLRTICSRSEQKKIEAEYTEALKLTPSLSLDQFVNQRYPVLFQGYRTSQQEVAAAVGACLAAEKDIRFIRTMSRAAGMARDPKAAVDRVMDSLRQGYPQYFQG
eukprot:gene6009-4314_t